MVVMTTPVGLGVLVADGLQVISVAGHRAPGHW
jgi:hypothetical protein